MGYFTCAQYDVLFYFLLRGKWRKAPIGDKSVGVHPPGSLPRYARQGQFISKSIVRWDISLALNMTYYIWWIAAVATLPRNKLVSKPKKIAVAQ